MEVVQKSSLTRIEASTIGACIFPYLGQNGARNLAGVNRLFRALFLSAQPVLLPIYFPMYRPLSEEAPSVERYKRLCAVQSAAPGIIHSVSLVGHEDNIKLVVMNCSGTRIFSADEGNILKLWDPRTGECLQTFNISTENMSSLALNLNGKRALLGRSDGNIELWDFEKGECSWSVNSFPGGNQEITQAAFSADGTKCIVIVNKERVEVRDIENGRLIKTGKGSVISLDGTKICQLEPFIAKVWDVETGNEILVTRSNENIDGAINSQIVEARFSSDGNQLILSIFREKRNKYEIYPLSGKIQSFPKNTVLCQKDAGSFPDIRTFVVNGDGTKLLLGDGSGGIGHVKIRDNSVGGIVERRSDDNYFVVRIRADVTAISQLMWSPDETYLFSRSWDDENEGDNNMEIFQLDRLPDERIQEAIKRRRLFQRILPEFVQKEMCDLSNIQWLELHNVTHEDVVTALQEYQKKLRF